MRTRVTTRQATLPAGSLTFWETNQNTGVTTQNAYNPPTASYVYTSLDQTITDQMPKRRQSGDCLHTKVSTSLLESPMTWYSWSPPSPYVLRSKWSATAGYLARKYVVPNIGQLSTAAVVIPPKWDEWSYDAVEKMRASLGDPLLLPNFIAELLESGREAKGAWARRKSAWDKRNARTNASSSSSSPFSKAIGSMWNRSANWMRRWTKRVAQINLFYQFVVRPTLGDAKALAEMLEHMQSRMAELIRGANKIQRGHYARRLDTVTLPADAQIGSTTFEYGGAQFMFRRSLWIERPKYCATMIYSYDASQLQSLTGQLNVLLHAFGVSKVASIYWEALPFSFVVDWFVNVGDVLSSLEDRLIDPFPMVIHDFCHSVKYVYRTNVEFNLWESQPPGAKYIVPALAYKEFHHYERRRCTPCLVDPLTVRSPSLNQAGLGLSLIICLMDGVKQHSR